MSTANKGSTPSSSWLIIEAPFDVANATLNDFLNKFIQNYGELGEN